MDAVAVVVAVVVCVPVALLVAVAEGVEVLVEVRERGINEGAFGQIYQLDQEAFERVGLTMDELNEMLDMAISQGADLQSTERKAA
jgi:hypothetical protein